MNSTKTILGTILGLIILCSTIFLLKVAAAHSTEYFNDDALLAGDDQMEKESISLKKKIEKDLKNLDKINDFDDLNKKSNKKVKYAKRSKRK